MHAPEREGPYIVYFGFCLHVNICVSMQVCVDLEGRGGGGGKHIMDLLSEILPTYIVYQSNLTNLFVLLCFSIFLFLPYNFSDITVSFHFADILSPVLTPEALGEGMVNILEGGNVLSSPKPP